MDLIITLSEGLTDTVAPYFTLSRDPTPPARLTAFCRLSLSPIARMVNGDFSLVPSQTRLPAVPLM